MSASNRTKPRIVFIDQARALAIVMMLVGHSLDRFLGEPWRLSETYQNYQFVRGLSSALFLSIAGFSFVIASLGRADAYRRLSSRLIGRVFRMGLIIFLGVLLQLPAGTLTESLAITDISPWERFFSFNVLQTIGTGLLALHGVLYITRDEVQFKWVVFALMLGIFAVASITFRPDVDAVLPMWFRGAVNLYHQSRFPPVPYMGFIFMGAFFGVSYWTTKGQFEGRAPFIWAPVLGGALLGFEQLNRYLFPGLLFPYGILEPQMAGNTFARAGSALLIISVLYWVSRRWVILSRYALLLSKDSLAIYFAHLLLVYGANEWNGLFPSHVQAMTPLQSFLWVLGLLGAMTGLALTLRFVRQNHFDALTAARRITVLSVFLSYLMLPKLSLLGIVFCGTIAWGLVIVLTKYFRRSVQFS